MKSFVKPIRFLFLALIFVTPLIFTQSNSELFELPKMYFVYFLTVLITIFHLINVFKNKAPLYRKSFLNIPLLLFLISQIISTYYSIDPHTSFFGYYSRLNGGLLSLICYCLLYLILVVYLDSDFKDKIINFSLLSAFIVSIYAIAQHFGIDKNMWVQDVQSRVFSTLGQPNWLAAYLCIIIPFSIYQFLNSSSFIHKSYFLLLTSSFYLSLLFTKSKSGLAAVAISVTLYIALYLIQNIKKSAKAAIIASSFIIFIFLILSIIINNPIKDLIFIPKTNITVSATETNKLNITSSGDIRKIVWKGALDLWKNYPIFGTGVETFAYSYYWTRPVEHNLTSEWDYLYNKAHNEYINYLATTGLVGLLTYLSIIITVLIVLFINHKSKFFIPLISSYITILITNSAGFSVVITSLFFFLLPALLNPQQEIPTVKLNKNKLRFLIIPVIIFLLICLKNIIFFYFADIAYSQSEEYDSKNNYQMALSFAQSSHSLNLQEPLYTNKLATIYSKLALSTEKQEYIDESIIYSDQTIKTSPANINFWKQRAQDYLYLSGVDTKYFSTAIAALTTAAKLAPTDPKISYSIGQFYETASLPEQAIPYYRQAIELKPNYDYAYFALGKIYLTKKENNLAKENLQKTVDYSYPTNLEAEKLLEQIKTTN